MYLTEIFETIQGEATFTGTPAIFIRTQGCGVGCSFCDTKFSWDVWDSNTQPQNIISVNTYEDLLSVLNREKLAIQVEWQYENKFGKDLAGRVANSDTSKISHFVITGGEPLQEDPQHQDSLISIIEGIKSCRSATYRPRIQIETSGTSKLLDKTYAYLRQNCFITLSPKIGMAGGKSFNPSMCNLIDEIKMPVGSLRDLENLEEFLATHRFRHETPIWLQPISQSEKATNLCIDYAKKKGYKVSIQTHKYINIY